MKLIQVANLPNPGFNSMYKHNRGLCNDFVDMNVKYARVEFAAYEYSSIQSANIALRYVVKRYKYPIRVAVVCNDIYFIRTDMEDSQ